MIGSCICPVLTGGVVHSNDCWLNPRPISEPCQSCADLTARVAALEAAATKLVAELNDWTVNACRDSIGNTNVGVLVLRRDELTHLLTPRATTEGA